MRYLFQLYKEKRKHIWEIIFGILIITSIYYFFINDNNVGLYLLFIFLSILIGINTFLNKIVDFKDRPYLLIVGFSGIILGLYKITLEYTKFYETTNFLIILFLILFSSFFLYFAYYLHFFVWKNNILKFKSEWNKVLIEDKVLPKLIHTRLFLILIFSAFFHGLYAVSEFHFNGYNVGFIHNFTICVLSLLIVIYSINELKNLKRKNFNSRKSFEEETRIIISRAPFLTLILYIVYDTLLEFYRDKNLAYGDLGNAFMFLLFFYTVALFETGTYFSNVQQRNLKKLEKTKN